MSFTVFLGNLPTWVTADDIKQWLAAEDLVSDGVKVIRNHETQESKGFAFVEAPTADEMESIIRRFDRAPLEDRLLRANPAQPPKGKDVRGVAVPAPKYLLEFAKNCPSTYCVILWSPCCVGKWRRTLLHPSRVVYQAVSCAARQINSFEYRV